MATPFIAQISLFAGNFAPRGWARCDGQLISIAQNTAVFSLLGTTYGGNGQTNFALPDLRGRSAVHSGEGPGLSERVLGETGGTEAHTLITSEMPAHSHSVAATTTDGNHYSPAGNLPAPDTAGGTTPYSAAAPNTTMNPAMIRPAGGGQPHNNRPPFLVVMHIMAMEGIFPSRN